MERDWVSEDCYHRKETTTRPNEADIICNRWEIGASKPGDTIELIELKHNGIVPNFYHVDGIEIKRKERV